MKHLILLLTLILSFVLYADNVTIPDKHITVDDEKLLSQINRAAKDIPWECRQDCDPPPKKDTDEPKENKTLSINTYSKVINTASCKEDDPPEVCNAKQRLIDITRAEYFSNAYNLKRFSLIVGKDLVKILGSGYEWCYGERGTNGEFIIVCCEVHANGEESCGVWNR